MTEYEELREKIAEVIHPEYERDKEEGNACLECVRAGKKADEILAITLKAAREWLEKYVFYIDRRGYIALKPNAAENWQVFLRGEMPEEEK